MKWEEKLKRLSRGEFLKISMIWTGGFWMYGITTEPTKTRRVLTDEESEIMDTLADCIIPPDNFAGGKDAGVTNFIDQQIGDNGYLSEDKLMYKTCLPALNKGSISDYGKRFIAMEESPQTEYLKKIEAGDYDNQPSGNDWGQFLPSSFFGKMKDHCMMGFYGSPKHGGNKNYISYRMIRF